MLFIAVEVFSLEWVGSESRPLLHVEVIVFEETALFGWACKDENVSLPLYEILMPKGTKTLGYNKALACKSRGFAHKKEGALFDTPSSLLFYKNGGYLLSHLSAVPSA